MIEPEYFAKKRAELGFERADQLAAVQAWLNAHYPAAARARMLHQGVLCIDVTSGVVASDLRLRQVELLAATRLADTRLAIGIGSIEPGPVTPGH